MLAIVVQTRLAPFSHVHQTLSLDLVQRRGLFDIATVIVEPVMGYKKNHKIRKLSNL